MAFVRHSREHGGNEFGVGGQGDIFLRTRADRVNGGARVGFDAASDHRNANMLGLEPLDKACDICGNVDHHQVGAPSRAERLERLIDSFGMCDLGTLCHRHFCGGGELSVQCSDD